MAEKKKKLIYELLLIEIETDSEPLMRIE